MKDKKVILFDLDGTITNSAPGIFNSFEYALKKFNINNISTEVMRTLIGPSLKYSFGKHFFEKESDVELAIKYYREYYSEKGIYENELYPGIIELLSKLKTKNKILNIASSKPTIYIEEILSHFNIIEFFDKIFGADLDGSNSDKKLLIEKNMLLYPNFLNSDFIMVGDRNYDIIGALSNNIESIGALYGFGTQEELEKAGATIIVDSVDSLQDLLV